VRFPLKNAGDSDDFRTELPESPPSTRFPKEELRGR